MPLDVLIADDSAAIGDPAAESGAAGLKSRARDPELVCEFLLESRDHLRGIERNLLAVEDGPASADAVHEAFRAFRAIRGLAGFLEFEPIRRVAHEVAALLDRVLEAEAPLGADAIAAVLAGSSFLRNWLDCVERPAAGGADSGPDPSSLIERLRRLQSGSPAGAVDEPAMLAALASAMAVSAQQAPAAARTGGTRFLQVDKGKLDRLENLIGEMAIAQSAIRHDPEWMAVNRPRLERNLSQLARITDEVRKTALAMRMVPVERLFERMRRVVRDLARQTGERVDLEIAGGDTELDRDLMEALAGPLTHIVRNAVDRVIENPERRIAAGTALAGAIRLSASHGYGTIRIEVAGSAGWGAGMEGVRTQVEKLGGRLDMRGRAGESYSCILQLPDRLGT